MRLEDRVVVRIERAEYAFGTGCVGKFMHAGFCVSGKNRHCAKSMAPGTRLLTMSQGLPCRCFPENGVSFSGTASHTGESWQALY